MNKVTFYFGVHNNQVKLYAVANGIRKNKALSLLGDYYKIKTSIDFWNKKAQCFDTHVKPNIPIPTAPKDNEYLYKLKRFVEEISNIREYYSCEDFFTACQSAKMSVEEKSPTLLEYVKDFAQLWKDNKVMGKGYKYDSGNYVIYEKLARRLQGFQYKKIQPWAVGIKKFANTPITEIGSKEYNDFLY